MSKNNNEHNELCDDIDVHSLRQYDFTKRLIGKNSTLQDALDIGEKALQKGGKKDVLDKIKKLTAEFATQAAAQDRVVELELVIKRLKAYTEFHQRSCGLCGFWNIETHVCGNPESHWYGKKVAAILIACTKECWHDCKEMEVKP